jgi:hypothetical protein
MYSRSTKGREKGDPNRNPWLAKKICTRRILDPTKLSVGFRILLNLKLSTILDITELKNIKICKICEI